MKMAFNLRKKVRVNYYEPEEPSFDNYVYCEECSDYVYEYCSIHGPLLVIPDDKVPLKHGYPEYVHQAALTIPHEFLHLATSIIPGAGLGVFTTLTLPRGVRFGPYRGLRKNSVDSTYCWQVYDRNHKPSHIVDATDVNHSNWMRYVNCARHWKEQNLVAYQYQGRIYYRTIKIIPRFTELLVFYGSEFANKLGIDLRIYNDVKQYPRILSNAFRKKRPQVTTATQKNGLPVVNKVTTLEFEKIGEIIEETEEENTYKNIEDNESPHFIEAITNFQNEAGDENKCDICLKIFSKRNGFHRHMRRMHKLIHLACSRCGYRVYDKNKLTDHINKCSKKMFINQTQHKCSICHRTFSKSTSLKRHIDTVHSDIEPFACNLCKYKTKYKRTLNNHILRHSTTIQNNSVTNSILNAKISLNETSLTLKKRVRNRHYSQPRSCDLCDFTTISYRSYSDHKAKHQGKIYQCTQCDYSSFIRHTFIRHVTKLGH